LAAFVLAAGIWLGGSGLAPARAQTGSDDRAAAGASAAYVDGRLAELKRLTKALEAEQAGLRRNISANSARRRALTSALEEFAAMLDTVQSRLALADSNLAAVQANLDAKSAELQATEHRMQHTLVMIDSRAVSIYKHGAASTFSLVFGARGFADLMRRFAYVLSITHVDNSQVADMRRQKETIVAMRVAVQELRDEAAGEAGGVRSERDRVASVRSALDSERTAIGGRLSTEYARLGSIAAQKARAEAEEQELRTESARIAAFLRGESNTPPTVSPKGMIWPVRGPVTSGFGWRIHPVLHTRRFHSGIDIGAPYGAPIKSAASGKVVFTGSETGYGNYVIVYHGGGIATLYAHMSSIGVGNGALVAQGQSIGHVGCTGYCTGPHVHFEVRVNGNPVDPMGWLA
jgi:murein DD-endopeptidase MepM/ murein hydrolase activator NlpD